MNATGRGELRLTVQGRRWRTRYRAPLFVNVLPAAAGSLLALPVDQGGGLRNGERQLQRVLLDHGAEVTWAPPASTLCLPAEDAAGAHLQLVADVRGASYLRLAGRPLIPFTGADVVQTTVVAIAAGSQCLLLESGCPGRTRMGESWAFTRLAYRLTVLRQDAVIYRERWELRPPEVPHAASGFDGNLGWATCVACGPRPLAELEDLRRWLTANGATVRYGSLGADLAVARILDPDGALVTGLADRVLHGARRTAANRQPAPEPHGLEAMGADR